MALVSDDEAFKRDAMLLVRWLSSHDIYTDECWKSASPAHFAAAMRKAQVHETDAADALADLALVVIDYSDDALATMSLGNDPELPSTESWPHLHHDIMYSPN